MDLATQLLREISALGLSRDEIIRGRCALAKELEEAGNYEAACSALGELWSGTWERPPCVGANECVTAEVLLRVGTLSGWVGSARQLPQAQEAAKNLLGESQRLFAAQGARSEAAEAKIELAWCYWREGLYPEARIHLVEALSQLPDDANMLRAVALVRCAEVERAACRPHEARRLLGEAAVTVGSCPSHALKGKFHSTLAGVMHALGSSDGQPDYLDCALIELSAASFHFEQAGHARHRARVENNLGMLLFSIGRYDEAHEHLRRARRLFESLKDYGGVAQVNETCARVLLAQGRLSEAEKFARRAVKGLEESDERGFLAEALTTHGIVLARAERYAEGLLSLRRALLLNELNADPEGIAEVALSLLEEFAERLQRAEAHELYRRADESLTSTMSSAKLLRLRACARRLLEPPTQTESVPAFVHVSQRMMQLLGEARTIARADAAVLLTGETGTGKEILARLIHQWSGRRGRFVAINCAALCESLVESQLFGHRRGSFTGANEEYAGTVREAVGGTLFLDEVGDLNLAHQAKLLRLVGDREICQVGSAVTEHVDVRIIAATNRDLTGLMTRQQFRADLYYRLATFHLHLPPLRERYEDIRALAQLFIAEAQTRHSKLITFTDGCLMAMCCLPLAGNARELRSLIERTFITAEDGAVITGAEVETLALRCSQDAGLASPWAGCSLENEVRAYEGKLIRLALTSAQGSITRAARLLNLTHQGLAYILKGRHQELLLARRPARRRRKTLLQPASPSGKRTD